MLTNFYKTLLAVLGMFLYLCAEAQTVANVDSVMPESDSLVRVLRNQVQELQLERIMMQERLAETGRSDSLWVAERKARIDSLRKITPGAPLGSLPPMSPR